MVSHRGTPLVIEGPAALELSIQLSFRSELQDEVNARRVVEVTVQTQDIGMSGRDGEWVGIIYMSAILVWSSIKYKKINKTDRRVCAKTENWVCVS